MTGTAPPHGSDSTYTNHRCRCVDCTAAHARAQQAENAQRSERLRRGLVQPPHGLPSTYTNYACRCTPCRGAVAAERARYRKSGAKQ